MEFLLGLLFNQTLELAKHTKKMPKSTAKYRKNNTGSLFVMCFFSTPKCVFFQLYKFLQTGNPCSMDHPNGPKLLFGRQKTFRVCGMHIYTITHYTTLQKSNIDTKKWPYLKGVHLFQTIILGIMYPCYFSGMYIHILNITPNPRFHNAPDISLRFF